MNFTAPVHFSQFRPQVAGVKTNETNQPTKGSPSFLLASLQELTQGPWVPGEGLVMQDLFFQRVNFLTHCHLPHFSVREVLQSSRGERGRGRRLTA